MSWVHEPRSLQPTDIDAMPTRRSLAAPSITARSIETGLSRSYAAVSPDSLAATVPIIVTSPVYRSIASRIARRCHRKMPAFQATPSWA